MSQEVTLTTDQVAKRVTSVGAPTAVNTAASSFTETLNKSGTITKVAITSPTGSVTFDTAAGATIVPLTIDPTIRYASNTSTGSMALAADPTNRWNYQSFGLWETGRVTGSGNVGVMSIGAPTATIPTSGMATFTGKSVGFYIDANGVGHTTFSDLSVNADFAARTLGLSSAGTAKTLDFRTISPSPDSNLNFTGTLTYAAGTNSFVFNNLTNSGGTLTGTSTGRFYGPSAEELGGVFILKAGSGVETYGGAYGAKRGAIAP